MIKFFLDAVLEILMLNLIFAESALEPVPKVLWKNHSVMKRATALGKAPENTLLDRSYHHRAMLRLEESEKRGRPDIVHFALLEALGAPLNREGLLRVYVHTIDNYIISIDPKVRLPKNYNRFIGLIEQLYAKGAVPLSGPSLLKVKKGSLKQVVSEIEPSYVVAFTSKGEEKILEDAVKILSEKDNSLAIIGAFPHGHFSDEIIKLTDLAVSIDPEMLEAWTMTSRVIYEYEKLIGLPKMRWNKG